MGFEFPSLNRTITLRHEQVSIEQVNITSHDLTTGEQDKGLVAIES